VKVVLDANVLVSAAIQTGPSYRLVARWLDRGGIEVVICPALLAEVEDVLDRPRLRKRVDPELAQLYMATVRRIADVVSDPAPIAARREMPMTTTSSRWAVTIASTGS